MKLSIIGTGYVGLVTGTCFAEVGHQVTCVDNDAAKVDVLQHGGIPIFEPGLDELVKKNVGAGRLSFTTSTAEGVEKSDVIFIAVPTPPQADGSVDLSFIEKVAREMSGAMTSYKIVVDKSTVPVRTGADRIVIGVRSQRPVPAMKEIYAPFKAPVIITDINSAELIKHASNSFLALKISYINAISVVCEAAGANVQEVALGMGMDERIGRRFLNPSLGFGGSCFPKDLSAFIKIAEQVGYDFRLLKEVQRINAEQMERFVKKITDTLWVLRDKHIGVLGLAFKQNTDDVRTSPAIDLCQRLQKEGAILRVHDPKAMEKAKVVLQDVTFVEDMNAVAEGCDALVIATEWEEFKKLDLDRARKALSHPIMFDGRNLFDPAEMEKLGFIYKSIGR